MFSLIIFWEVNEFRILFLYKFELGHETHSAAEIYLKYSWNIRLDYRRYTRRKFTCGNENLENEPQDKPKSILNWTKIKGKVKADSRSDIWKKLKKEDQKLRRLEALCLSRKTRNGTSPFLSRIIIHDPDNNWMLIPKPSRKSYDDSEEKFYKNRIYKMNSNITRKRQNFFFSTKFHRYFDYSSVYTLPKFLDV